MSWVAAAVAVLAASSAYQGRQQRRAARKGRKEQEEDATRARRAEVFAETEGEGIGNLGVVSLEVDDDEISGKVDNKLSI